MTVEKISSYMMVGRILIIRLTEEPKGVLEIHSGFPREILFNDEKIVEYEENHTFLRIQLPIGKVVIRYAGGDIDITREFQD